MTDEEKEAIEWLKRLVKLNKRDNLDDTFAEILLNLIEKQSKEIEALKEKNKNAIDFINDKKNYFEDGENWQNVLKIKIFWRNKKMSDEEKKAIERFKNFIYTYQEVIEDEYSDYEEKESAKEYQKVSDTILNLIEKQYKEIEELKNQIINYASSLGGRSNGKTELLRHYKKGYDMCNKFWKDKIKAKIEEIDEVLKGQLIEKIRVYFEAQKEILQSLLEKEE